MHFPNSKYLLFSLIQPQFQSHLYRSIDDNEKSLERTLKGIDDNMIGNLLNSPILDKETIRDILVKQLEKLDECREKDM